MAFHLLVREVGGNHRAVDIFAILGPTTRNLLDLDKMANIHIGIGSIWRR